MQNKAMPVQNKAMPVPCKAMPVAVRSTLAFSRSTPALPMSTLMVPSPLHPHASWITTLPFLNTQVFLGSVEAAKDHNWLRHAKINILVRCLPAGPCRPRPPRDTLEVEWLFTRSFWGKSAFFTQALRTCRYLAKALPQRQNILFWCNHGKHRSAAALACFLLFGMDQDPELLMVRIRDKRPIVQPDAQPVARKARWLACKGAAEEAVRATAKPLASHCQAKVLGAWPDEGLPAHSRPGPIFRGGPEGNGA